ncbi:Plant peroxidase [Corchorus capsularis]|uniref:Peroxidase n=1 Tax=Corchorus capsularis TaxID=210143 RepID=A0A1R3HRF3_COCAP|nr:Plant peroxidase [Corchorus capsularis]
MILISSSAASLPLRKGFYQKKCPSAETIVRNAVKAALASDPGIPAALIRLHFHDCFVRGCDASILLDSTPNNKAEKDSMGNKGVQGFQVIDEAKAKLEAQCPNSVSCSDIIAFAVRDSVTLAGGPYYDVPAGRRDGRISSIQEVTKNLPDVFFNVTQLKENFAHKGLSVEEMVTLSGAHSIGDSHCSSFSKRLYSFNKTVATDPSIDVSYVTLLKAKCPKPLNNNGANPDPLVPFDPVTPNRLDNNYYKNLKSSKGLLASDQTLWDTAITRNLVKGNVNHPSAWAKKFAAAMLHMGSIEVLTGTQGEIRKNCRVVN